jgi:signal transduction histidine kinase/ligand-binding sensor domain-containing protein/DNA-binding response OmpR family regulator
MYFNKIKIPVLLLIVFLLTVQKNFAQTVFFKNYTVADGLCANTVWDIAQDTQGYMWFGTKYGLNRFDGYEFKSYQYQKNNPQSIGNNFIRKIFNYNATTFWIGTDEGIYVFNLETENFSLFKPLGKQFINDIIGTRNGNIWIATKTNGVYSYNPNTNKIKRFSHNINKPNGISSNEVSKLLEDKEGNIWVGTYGKGIDVLVYKSKKFKHYRASADAGALSNNVILDIYKDLDGNIWAGTMSGGLNKYNPAKDNFTAYTKTNKNSISDNIVRSIYQPRPGILYLATEKGLNIFDTKKNHFTSYQNKNNDQYSLSDDAVYKIFKDHEGGIWVGTYFGGLNYYNPKASGFEYYYPSGVSNSLSGNAVSAFLEIDAQHFWVGTEDGGLNYFNEADKSFKKFPFSATQDSLSYHNIHALYKDKKGNIWVGMYTGGLNILNPQTGKIKRYKSDANNATTLSDNSIYAIDEDRKGRIWVSTISGLNLYNPATDNFTRIKGKNLEKSCIYQVYQDADGILWVATYDKGLIGLNTVTNVQIQYSHSPNKNSISSNKVISIFDDAKGNLWLGTDGGGLNLFNKTTKKFTVIDKRYGINSTVVFGILSDASRNLWCSTNNGILAFNPSNKSKRYFGKWDNLQSQQYNYKAYYKSRGGKMYFGGINGFNAFYPDSISNLNLPVAISFTNFQLFNKDLPLGQGQSPLKKAINYSANLTLNAQQSVISFTYSALSFIAPNKIRYAYKMDGFDKDWNHVGAQRKATYTNLPAGDYVFKVTQIDDKGNLGKNPASIKLKVLPPFYLSIVAYIFYAIVLILGLFYYRRYTITQTRKNNDAKLEKLKNKNEQDFYKQKIEFFTAMAHEIRTPLSLIIAPLEKLIHKSDKASDSWEQLQIMDENADRLLNLVNQLLDFRRIESDIFEIHTENIELVSFVHALYDRFSPMSFQKGFTFTFNPQIEKLNVQADPEALTKILSNLLVNAFKFTRTSVEICIHNPIIQNGHKMLSISVQDDGIGIPQAQLEHIFQKFFKITSDEHHYSNLGGTGIGLALAKSLSEKHGGKLLVESKPNIKTTFTVLLPHVQEQILPAQLTSSDEDELLFNNDKQTVLVVEDDPALLNFIYKSLLEDGYQAIKAVNGADAFTQLENHKVDIIISDVMMPVMDGIVFCSTLKKDINYCHIPVILLTAKTNSDAEIEGLESGADAYIPKPFKWKQISLITKNLLELRTNLKQHFAQHPFAASDILPSSNRDKNFMIKLTQAIEDRITDPQLSVEDLGREVGMSRSSLYKKVKTITGHVPNEFIRLIRLKYAAKLLSENQYNISEIGYLVGFNSHSYFSKCFYQQFQLTPSEFLENRKNNTKILQ